MSSQAWRRDNKIPSLSEVFRTIAVGNGGSSRLRRFLAFRAESYRIGSYPQAVK
jgi:manganese transport protein